MVAFAAANAILHLSVHKDWIALLQFLFLNLLHNLLLTLNLQLDRCCTSGILNERVPVQNDDFLHYHSTTPKISFWTGFSTRPVPIEVHSFPTSRSDFSDVIIP